MIHARIDLVIMGHRRAYEAGPEAMGVWLFAVGYAREQETDGFVPARILHGAWGGRSNAKLAARLVESGLLVEVPGGYRVRRIGLPRPRARGRVRERVIARGLVCGICNRDVPPNDVHIDHIQALANGGAHEESNLQVAHSLCNKRKGAR